MNETVNRWRSPEHAQAYLTKAGTIPHRREGEAVLLQQIPQGVKRILDLGTGDGRLLALLKVEYPQLEGVALDFSPTMLEAVRSRFADDPSVEVISHNLEAPLPDLGLFDAIVSSFAIHHLSDARKRLLYTEIYEGLTPGGIFCNLEHVAPLADRLHQQFLAQLDIPAGHEDPSNQLLDVETQLQWLREIGYSEVDCYWKWLEMALLVGVKPGG
jgi:SAM-dependent methyltransferase